jgi:transcription elongation factor GreA
MTSTERLWMTREAHTRLQAELAALRSRPSIEVPDDFMDYDDNLVAKYAARQARIRQIQDLLTNAVVGEDPPDDGIAEPGMVLTVRYDDTGEIETFLLGVRGAEDADIDVYSMQSPLGSAITGARVGEQRTYSIPSGANLPVTLLKAVPYGMHTPKPARSQAVPPRRTSEPRRRVATRTDSDRTTEHTNDHASCPRRHLEGNEHDHYATCLDLTAGPRTATPGTGHPAVSVFGRNR